MPTSTPLERANRSASRRLNDWVDKLTAAKLADHRANSRHDKQQWGTLMGWLLSESKHLSDTDRRRMFDHLVGVARQMNEASRTTPH